MMLGEIAQKRVERIKDRHNVTDAGIISAKATAEESGGSRDIVAIATTEDMDLEREIIVASGVNPAHFEQNRSIFVDHWYDTDHCIGKLRNRGLSKIIDPATNRHVGWKARFSITKGLRGAQGDLAHNVWAMAKDGGIGVSIGFEPKDRGQLTEEERELYGDKPESIVRTCNLLELSVTPIPCNVVCRTVEDLMARSVELDRAGISKETIRAMGLPEPEVKPKRRVILLG